MFSLSLIERQCKGTKFIWKMQIFHRKNEGEVINCRQKNAARVERRISDSSGEDRREVSPKSWTGLINIVSCFDRLTLLIFKKVSATAQARLTIICRLSKNHIPL